MKKIFNAEIIENIEVAKNIYRLIVKAEISAKPGQFIEIRVTDALDPFLRRPIRS